MDDEIDRIDLRISAAEAARRKDRREWIATAMLPDAAKSIHALKPDATWQESTRSAAIVALSYADALIAELDK